MRPLLYALSPHCSLVLAAVRRGLVAPQPRLALPGEIPTGAYTTWDLSVAMAFPGAGFTVTPVLSVDNLLDVVYVDPLSRYRPYGIPAPGRSVRLSVRVGF